MCALHLSWPQTCLHAAATDHAVESGFGRGEFQGAFNNMRAIAVAIAPIVYGRTYAGLTKRGIYPGRVWLLLAVRPRATRIRASIPPLCTH